MLMISSSEAIPPTIVLRMSRREKSIGASL